MKGLIATTNNAPVESFIINIRGEKVILDFTLARIYGVTTSRFNEAVKRNRHRFPADFRFQLTRSEWEIIQALRSQNAILNRAGRGQYRKYLPYAFTEHGALMAANVLNSSRAVEMSVYVIRAFIRIRQELAVNENVSRRLAEIEKTLLKHDSTLRDLYAKIRPLLLSEPSPKHRGIGFHVKYGEPGKNKRSMKSGS